MSPPMAVTEDTPADMLAGSMDLHIVLPSGQVVRTSVLRSTPMMDLLVQVTTAHRLSPGSHSLQAMGERGALPFKPSTPIGALDTFTVRIVQKKSSNLKKAPQIPDVLPHTFRLQVHLPRSQLFVMRVTPQVIIREVLKQVCREKNLDPVKYELRKTGNMNQVLECEKTLGEVQTQELTLVVRGADHVRPLSSADIIHVKEANNRQNSVCDSSLSSGSLGSRSISPVVAPAPQPPTRKKRRPAPKPPEHLTRTVVISHSRESSDSSGYHEPSTLSESPTHNGPPSDISSSARSGSANISRNSASMSNLTTISINRLNSCVSVSSLSSNGPSKKKRAPPPPTIKPTPIELKQKSATLPADIGRQPDPIIPPAPVELAPSPPATPDIESPVPQPRLNKPPSASPRGLLTRQPSMDDLENVELPQLPNPVVDEPDTPKPNARKAIVPVIQESVTHSFEPTMHVHLEEFTETPPVDVEEPADSQPNSLSVEWEYQLPPPPTHFRDDPEPKPTDPGAIDSLNGIYEEKITKQQIILNHKSEVMNELTNVLSRTRLQEKFSNLYYPSAGTEGKNKLNHSQSFIMNPAPISNFKISNYEPRPAKTAEDVEFKRPMLPAKKVRRADSMNIKRISADKEELKQKFLEFLIEKDIPVELVDVSEIIPKHVVVNNAKVEEEEEVKVVEEAKPAVKRPAWQPPAISMGTWGERPKTKITIKDEDYTTEVIVPEKRTVVTTPVEMKPIQLRPVAEKKASPKKKPTNYELFSALSRKVDLEEEKDNEKKLPPVICGVELKKEFRSEPDLIQGLGTDRSAKSDVPKIVDAQNLTKVRLGPMPVVKGFRMAEKKPEPAVKQEFSMPKQGIPTPPPMGNITLKPVSCRPIQPKLSDDPRSELLEQIRAFGGFNRLRKTVQ